MAIHTIYPTKDTTIYSHTGSNNYNYGLDEMLDITKYVSHSQVSGEQNSRICINFTSSDFPSAIGAGEISMSYLQLYCAHEIEISRDYDLIIGRGDDFVNGTGTIIRRPAATDGAGWKYSDIYLSKAWRQNFPMPTNAEATNSALLEQYTTSSKSPFNQQKYNADIYHNVQENVKQGTGSWGGQINFVIHRGPQETNGAHYGSLHYFSNESKTIFKPRLHLLTQSPTHSYAPTAWVSSSHLKITSEGKYNLSVDSVERIYFNGITEIEKRNQLPEKC